jgi:hypothetical protein
MNYTKRKCKNTDLCQNTHFLEIKSLRTDTYHRSTVSVQLCPKTDRFKSCYSEMEMLLPKYFQYLTKIIRSILLLSVLMLIRYIKLY